MSQNRQRKQSSKQFEGQRKKNKTQNGYKDVPVKQKVNIEEEVSEDFEDIEDDEDDSGADFEDEYDDEYEEEDAMLLKISKDNEEVDENSDDGIEVQQLIQPKPTLKRKKEFEPKEKPLPTDKRVWFNEGVKDEQLEFDNRAYNMLHRVNTEWPCLSCDWVVPDEQQELISQKQYSKMDNYPYTVYVAAGTQASQSNKNQLYLMKFSKLHKTKYDDDSDVDDSEDEDILNDEEGEIHLESVQGLKYGVNRLRTMNYKPIVAYWSENGDVVIANLKPLFTKIQEKRDLTKPKKDYNLNQIQHKVFQNKMEGFALDWSPISIGHLATGSVDSRIYTYAPKDELGSDFIRDSKPYTYHTESVEDIQWSPVENFAFASCSVDGTVQVCDTRQGNRQKSQILIKAHDTDVNVISWNSMTTNLLASGADDGSVKVWDLRYPTNDCICELQWHKKSITSIQFQPSSDSTLAVSSADNNLSIWDYAVENDDVEIQNEEDIPDQLMFVHQGQIDLKELRYHPIYTEMLISTSGSGFNIFKPSLDEEESEKSDDEKDVIPQIREEDLDKYLARLTLQ